MFCRDLVFIVVKSACYDPGSNSICILTLPDADHESQLIPPILSVILLTLTLVPPEQTMMCFWNAL
jgi:hypothetical protein